MIERLIEAYKSAEIAKDAAWQALSSAIVEAAPWKVGDKIEHTDYWERVRVVRVTKVYATSDGWKVKTYVAKACGFPLNKDGSTSNIGERTIEQSDQFTLLDRGI